MNASDPNAFKEMNLLNRMMTGRDLGEDDPTDTQEDKDREKASAERMAKKYGVSREKAGTFMRILNALTHSKEQGVEDELGREPELTEPPSPGGIH
jgi:hypothetical protein